MKVGITGASGLIGSALAASLRQGGHDVTRFVRTSQTSTTTSDDHRQETTSTTSDNIIEWDITAGTVDVEKLARLDAVVHLAGAGIADHRWTPSYRRELVHSRVDSTDLLAHAMVRAKGPTVLISGSAIGYYGDRGDEILTEQSPVGVGFLPELCTAWESATAPAVSAGLRVALLRTGTVLSPSGGALAKMLPLFKMGLGGKFGNGNQWMSWITIDDEVRAIEHLLATEVEGPFNLTSPNPRRNSEFVRSLAAALSRPSRLPVPRFGPRLLLGGDLANSLLFESQRIVPEALLQSGFDFDFANLDDAFRHLLT